MSKQDDLLSKVKNAWNEAYGDASAIDSLPWVNTDIPKEILTKFVRNIQRKDKERSVRILDFGCGNGRIGEFLEKFDRCEVFYYDISEKALDYCVGKGISRKRVIRDISECKEHFDGIVVWGVFHHLDPILWSFQLEQIIDLLEPEGALLFGDFTKEDRLFAKDDSRESEVTKIPTYPVDYGFVGRRLHILYMEDFKFLENQDCEYHRDFERRMKVVIAERYLVDQKEAIVKQKVDGLKNRPEFWHFVKYSFRDSLSVPHGKAVTFISESDPTVAQELWLEGLALFRHHDAIYPPEEALWNKSLSEELFVRSDRKHSFYVDGEKSDHVSVKIKWVNYEGSGQHFEIHLKAPRLSLRKPKKNQFPETDSFPDFISQLKDAVSKSKAKRGGDRYRTLFDEASRELNEQLESYPEIPFLPVFMMILMVWPANKNHKKFFDFIQPPVFQENLGDNTMEISAGGLVLYSNKPILTFKDPLIPAINRWATLYTTLELVKYTRLKAVGAAIAQVMARNMSHNFGSHVLSYFISPDAYQKFGDKYVSELRRYGSLEGDDLSTELFKDVDEGKNYQAAYFMQYLKSRMDYLSEVTFGVSDLVTTKMMYGDVMKELDRARILLNHISGIEDFKYHFRVVGADGRKDLGVAFPNDVLGCQAFYNIVENIIRNTAKHNGENVGGKEVVFTIRIMEVHLKEGEAIDGSNDLYCVEIDDGLPIKDIDDLVRLQNERLNESVLDANNNLRSHSLGLLEMKASAAFLRQIDLADIVSEEYQIDIDREDRDWHEYECVKRMNIIKAFKAPVQGRGYALGYRFFLQKPKEFLFVGDDWVRLVPDQRQKEVLPRGIQFVSTSDFKKSLDDGEAYAHPFLIYDETSESVVHDCKNQSLLPIRIISDKEGTLARLIQDGALDKLLTALKDEAWKMVIPEDVVIQGVLQTSSQRQVIFKHHKETYPDDFKRVFRHEDVQFEGKEIWLENLTSRTMHLMPEFASYSYNPDDPDDEIGNYILGVEFQERIVRSLYEAYHDKVIIIDERVQQYAEKNAEDSIPCWQLFESTHVFIPRGPSVGKNGKYVPPLDFDQTPIPLNKPNVIPLAPDSFDKYKKKIKRYIKDRIDDACLIIHYGILERMYGRDKEAISEQLREWAKKAKRVVVTSGRGSHSIQLPDEVCFASLSSVLYACNESRNKYLINNLVHQARRKRK